jgi:hypothetical protein
LKESNSNIIETRCEPIDKVSKIDLNEISSPVLSRLIEEVRNEEIRSINAYNRMHNRHNRSR